ncbi:Mss4-like protein [Alternaria rosae]|uniref:Mss4-like protein n=1 Tax=Alternaria rosae TaxID=1187941 RepID=UPI001E8DB1DF|nr:Mss4-like protein [Alternaria rosae]KAH6875954.1 Mss4-like protein [Alternaria rosae]
MAEGRCNCGSIKVSMPSMPEQSAICYCANCRRAGGSIGSIVYILDSPEVTINDPSNNLKSYKDNDTKSGNPITRQFCGTCGCPITSLLAGDKIALKGGLFDKIPVPGYKSFEQEEPSWMKIV